jgi:hypothetical protein
MELVKKICLSCRFNFVMNLDGLASISCLLSSFLVYTFHFKLFFDKRNAMLVASYLENIDCYLLIYQFCLDLISLLKIFLFKFSSNYGNYFEIYMKNLINNTKSN